MYEGRKRSEEKRDLLGEFLFRLFPITVCGSLRSIGRRGHHEKYMSLAAVNYSAADSIHRVVDIFRVESRCEVRMKF